MGEMAKMEHSYYGELAVVCMPGCEKFVDEVDGPAAVFIWMAGKKHR